MDATRAVIFAVFVGLPACSEGYPPAVSGSGVSWTAADSVFHQEPRWLGGDGAYSVDLGGGRVAWLFGDTFVATSAALVRAESEMVRNTVAVQTGLDPTTAAMQAAWGPEIGGRPTSVFGEIGDRWHWPGGGARLPSGKVAVFLMIQRPTPGEGLGFASDGWRVAFVSNPDDPPSKWLVTLVDPQPQPFDAVVGTAVALEGAYLYALAASSDSNHVGRLARFPLDALDRRDLGAIEWWTGARWASPSELRDAPAVVMDDAGSEASLHRDDRLGLWLHIASRGFGATTIAVRTAPAVTGPWSDQADVFTPPESLEANPFVYAAKAHPEIATPDATLAVTYATNSFRFEDLLTVDGARRLYWPRFARIRLVPR